MKGPLARILQGVIVSILLVLPGCTTESKPAGTTGPTLKPTASASPVSTAGSPSAPEEECDPNATITLQFNATATVDEDDYFFGAGPIPPAIGPVPISAWRSNAVANLEWQGDTDLLDTVRLKITWTPASDFTKVLRARFAYDDMSPRIPNPEASTSPFVIDYQPGHPNPQGGHYVMLMPQNNVTGTGITPFEQIVRVEEQQTYRTC